MHLELIRSALVHGCFVLGHGHGTQREPRGIGFRLLDVGAARFVDAQHIERPTFAEWVARCWTEPPAWLNTSVRTHQFRLFAVLDPGDQRFHGTICVESAAVD